MPADAALQDPLAMADAVACNVKEVISDTVAQHTNVIAPRPWRRHCNTKTTVMADCGCGRRTLANSSAETASVQESYAESAFVPSPAH